MRFAFFYLTRDQSHRAFQNEAFEIDASLPRFFSFFFFFFLFDTVTTPIKADDKNVEVLRYCDFILFIYHSGLIGWYVQLLLLLLLLLSWCWLLLLLLFTCLLFGFCWWRASDSKALRYSRILLNLTISFQLSFLESPVLPNFLARLFETVIITNIITICIFLLCISWLSLENKWQQVSSLFRSFQYSGRSQLSCCLEGLYLTSYLWYSKTFWQALRAHYCY